MVKIVITMSDSRNKSEREQRESFRESSESDEIRVMQSSAKYSREVDRCESK